MNQLLFVVVALVLFIHFGGNNVPKILKDNKQMIYGVTIVLVLCSFFGANVEGAHHDIVVTGDEGKPKAYCAAELFEYGDDQIPEKSPLKNKELRKFPVGGNFALKCDSGDLYASTAGTILESDGEHPGYLKISFNPDLDGQVVGVDDPGGPAWVIPESLDGGIYIGLVEPNNLVTFGHTSGKGEPKTRPTQRLNKVCVEGQYLVGKFRDIDDMSQMSVKIADLVNDTEIPITWTYPPGEWGEFQAGCKFTEKIYGRWTDHKTFVAHTLGVTRDPDHSDQVCPDSGWRNSTPGNITFTFNEGGASVTFDLFDPAYTIPLYCESQPPTVVPIAPIPIEPEGPDPGGH